jgi:hypothetical protein
VPAPAATHREPFHAIEYISPKRALPEADSVQDIPSTERAILAVVPFPPPVIHKEPFHAIDFAPKVRIEFAELDAVQVIPLYE